MNRQIIGPIKDFAEGIYDGPHATPKEADEGPVFLGIKNVTPEGRLDFSEIRHVSEQEFAKWTRRVTPQEGDVVFSYEATLHRYALIPEGFRGCLGRRMALVRPKREKLNPRFLHYYFMAPKWKAVIESNIISGATVDRVPIKKFPDFEIAVPPLESQKAIADILSAYDDLIENNRRRMALLEESARLLYREWFVHLRFPGHEHVPITDGVPEGWEKTTLSRFIESEEISLQTGPFGTQLKASDYVETGIPVINVRNIGYGSIRPEKLEFLPERKAESLAKHRLDSGDIVFGRKGAVDRHVLVGPNEEGWMQGSDCIRLRVEKDERLSPVLLSVAFREDTHKQWMLGQCGNKATMASLNQEVIARIPVVVPSSGIHQMFGDLVKDIIRQVAILGREADAAAEARDLLLPRLMNGELTV